MKVKFTKFLKVKSPVGIEQRNETLTNYSIGCDLYLPKINEEFLDAIKNHPTNQMLYDNHFTLPLVDFENRTITIAKGNPLCIPTGIGFDIPGNYWAEVRSKSSNMNYGFTVVHGTVDMNYTYGVGVQIVPLTKDVILHEDQKIAQVVFHEAVPIEHFVELTIDEWNEDPTILEKRQTRVGGFGSTTKFDKV